MTVANICILKCPGYEQYATVNYGNPESLRQKTQTLRTFSIQFVYVEFSLLSPSSYYKLFTFSIRTYSALYLSIIVYIVHVVSYKHILTCI